MPKKPPYFLYVLDCKDNTLYTGITNDLDRRLKQHKEGSASRYTRAKGVRAMVYTERCGSRSKALKREVAVKKLSRSQKEALIKTQK